MLTVIFKLSLAGYALSNSWFAALASLAYCPLQDVASLTEDFHRAVRPFVDLRINYVDLFKHHFLQALFSRYPADDFSVRSVKRDFWNLWVSLQPRPKKQMQPAPAFSS